jgi:hypothetical protein
VILVVGCSLGPGPWRCNQLLPQDTGPGAASGSGGGASWEGPLPPPAPPPPPGPTPTIRPAPPPPPPPTPPPQATPPPLATPPLGATPRREEPTPRETLAPRKPPSASSASSASAPPRIVIAEEIAMTAVRALQPTFLACWKRAQRSEPSLVSARIRLSLEIDAAGAVTSSRTDAENEQLARCLANVARKLTFPAPGRPAALDVPLFF